MILRKIKTYLLAASGAIIVAQGAAVLYLNKAHKEAEAQVEIVREQARREAAVAANNRFNQTLARQQGAMAAREEALMGRIRAANEATRRANTRANDAIESLSDFERRAQERSDPGYQGWAAAKLPPSVAPGLRELLQSDTLDQGDQP
jgi:hypothetical protein